MDKQTRKLNFQKLQLPASSRQRITRSSKDSATTTIPTFFVTPKKNNCDEVVQQKSCSILLNDLNYISPTKTKYKLPKLSTFLNKEEITKAPSIAKAQRESDVFEKAQPKVRKAPKLTSTTATKKNTRKGRTKKQPSIKSALLRNEQLFSEITAQHCIADNFSPDDIELALALSKSETQTSINTESHDVPEEVVDLNERDSVRTKLQKYGFRTASREDYNTLAVSILPGLNRCKRSKWANKFTALTLRNPDYQAKKLSKNIDVLLAKQFKTKPLSENERLLLPYKLLSNSLKHLESQPDSCILTITPERGTNDISSYYVKELFEMNLLPAGHLLKNWAAIQGRDLSPERQSARHRERAQKLRAAYADLEKFFATSTKSEKNVKRLATAVEPVTERKNTDVEEKEDSINEDLNELLELLNDHELNKTQSLDLSSTTNSPIKEPPDKRARVLLEPVVTKESNKENFKLSRSGSPDIFADSDGDDSTFSVREELTCGTQNTTLVNFSLKAHKNISMDEVNENIETYEVFSSDEVKISANARESHVGGSTNDNLIDLTAEQNESLTTQEIQVVFEPLQSNCEDDLLNVNLNWKTSPYQQPSNSSENQTINTSIGLSDLSENCVQKTSKHRKSISFSQFLAPSTSERSIIRKSCSLVDSKESSASGLKNSFEIHEGLPEKLDNSDSSSISLSAFNAILQDSGQSIDLTQNESEEEDNDDDCILLSDDEINYSIWKADKTLNTNSNDLLQGSKDSSLNSSKSNSHNASESKQNSINQKTLSPPAFDHGTDDKALFAPIRFDGDEELDAFMVCSQTYSEKSGNSRSPNKSLLSRERAEFGIMDAALSEPISFSQLEGMKPTEQEPIDWAEASFLDSPKKQITPSKRYSCTENKFRKLLTEVAKSTTNEIDALDEMDDFDKIVFGAIKSYNTNPIVPSGLDQLLTGEINIEEPSAMEASKVTPTKRKTNSKQELNLPEQVEVNGNVYTVCICQTPKPDFMFMSDDEMLQQLYNYGIKPLKRKQAIKMLEFVYNQTHPILLANSDAQEKEPAKAPKESTWFKSKSTPVLSCKEASSSSSRTITQVQSAIFTDTNCVGTQMPADKDKLQLHDTFGDQLLRFSQELRPDLVDGDECYILQTNVTKKTQQPLLPLHIAWHNLICGNPALHEKVLMYEPIDLQEIYLYLKSLGYRYEPKDLKGFFDRRCIIFRYELTAPGKQLSQRHVRKPKRKKLLAFV